MSSHDTSLLVIDVQEKLIPAILESQRVIWNIRRLVDGAQLLDIPVSATEQYPQGLGSTIPAIGERLNSRDEKMMFSMRECQAIMDRWSDSGRHNILLCGIETHVCVQQSVLDLLAEGFAVFLAVDAVGSRFDVDAQIALRRMEASGATLTTTEAALFEWCETAAHIRFKSISKLIRENGPEID